MADVTKIKLPDNSEYNLKDHRIPGVDTTPTSGSDNVVTSGGIYDAMTQNEYVVAAAINDLNDRLLDVEDSVTNISDTSITSETDPIFSASAAAGITSTDITNWNNKVSNVQADWNATTGLAVILNKPTIPSVPVTDVTVGGTSVLSNGTAVIPAIPDGLPSVTSSDNGKILQVSSGSWSVATAPSGGDTNVIETVKVNSTALTPDANKAVDVTVPIEVINLGTDPVSAPSGTYTRCETAISAGRTVALRVVDSEDNEVYYYYLHSTGVQYAGNWQGLYFSRVAGGYIFYYSLSTNDNLTHSSKSIGTLTGVKFNNTSATINGTVAEITATIPAAVTESTVAGWGFTKNAGTYSKPSGGIPATDLESTVQTSLGKADTALQSFTETDPTVPSWAKQSTKPTYTASEVGALPDTTIIPTVPTNISSFTNDANYVKYVLCADEAAYNAISSKDSGTLYLIPKTS